VKDYLREAIQQKLGDSFEMPFPPMTRREAKVPAVPGKAHAVIGMRRAGKTTFLLQCLADRLATGSTREGLVYFNFEDERLGDLEAIDLGLILDEFYRAKPDLRRNTRVTWCFDEIQVVSGWERFIRRMMDSENVEIFLSGSSARMLSREVATSMRGRALETIVTPFSFREFALSRGRELNDPGKPLSAAAESAWRSLFDDYLACGGFPEVARESLRPLRLSLLQSYVDTVIFRDVAERHGVGNLVALRAFVRQLLRQQSCIFSVSKTHADFRSRGINVSKETLLSFLEYLEDAFLVFTLPLACRSERRRQVNPRKLYHADHALSMAFQAVTGADLGHHLENIIACELARSGHPLAYVKTLDGHEVDFLAYDSEGREMLVQVAAAISGPKTREREIRSLLGAAKEYPLARRLLLVESGIPNGLEVPEGIEITPVWRWLIGNRPGH